ncbi:branched-chain-amino-acid aminotransferase 7 [Pyrus ussuriensis x Pyrus communis]|uniref:Branched-chain-amino-acid aminotransferase 7 n=1 Tax=Pyrus ussuriensis x Pyrus communis TaxID=2448454 RepID=A0A5N5FNW7_9ROSA|nr:branched-chain-amino-acid aminotransferase 7 [Pyrus ussuriensis x Pyrus communis]
MTKCMPLLMGSGPVLGIGPAPECTFLIFTSPIGNWYKVFEAVNKAKAKGFTDVLFLDAATGKNVEELRVMFTEIQTGVVEDKMGWTMQIH